MLFCDVTSRYHMIKVACDLGSGTPLPYLSYHSAKFGSSTSCGSRDIGNVLNFLCNLNKNCLKSMLIDIIH